MGRSINSGTLNKQKILSKISQVSIFSTYLNLSDNMVQYAIDTGELILSPLRYDEHPTCGFRYDNRGKLKFKDFNGFFWGDCFDLVAFIMSATYKKQYVISNKEDFIKVLRHITLMFKDVFYGQDKDINLVTDVAAAIESIRNSKANIELVIRDWDNTDKSEWGSIGVSLQDLNLEFIYPIEQYYINRSINPDPKYYHSTRDTCYGYVHGKDRTGIYSIKLYFPKRDKGSTRFITNFNHLEGIYTLDRDDYDVIIITKSTKDRVSIKATIKRITSLYGQDFKVNVGVINIPHETYKLRQSEYDWLKSKIVKDGVIASLMDNDRVGVKQAIWLRTNFIIPPLLIPKTDKAKDFAEWRSKLGFKLIYKRIIDTINNIKEYEKTIINKHDKLIRYQNESGINPFN